MSLLSTLRVAWQAFKTRRKMNRQFGKRPDPFGYAAEPYEVARLEAMDRALDGLTLTAVLEAGCAEGHFTERLSRSAASVTALDISAVAMARARERAPKAEFVEADLMSWEPGRTFDAIVLGDVLYYLDKPGVAAEFAALFPRVAGWLKPGGRILLAHGFMGDAELAKRRAFRERFEAAGLRLVSEKALDAARGQGVRCLLSVLEKRPD